LLSSATLQLFQLGIRIIWDRWKIKPYLGFAPGLAHLALPNQEIRWPPSTGYPVNSVDAWKSGYTVGWCIGITV
jgi:hypothetical protein